MFLVKIFERKWVIRFFGLALIIAPFFNLANSVLELPGIEKKYLIFYCWQFYKSAPFAQQLLQFSSIVIGTLMLRGHVSAWKYTLGLLGGYIIIQFTQLNANMRDNTNWLYLGINVLMFFFIADQIVLKPRPVQPVQIKPKVPEFTPVVFSEASPESAPVQSIDENVKQVSAQLKAETEAERSRILAEAATEAERIKAIASTHAETLRAQTEAERIKGELASQEAERLRLLAASEAEAARATGSAQADKLKAELEQMKLEQAEQLKLEIERLRAAQANELAAQAKAQAEALAAQQAQFAQQAKAHQAQLATEAQRAAESQRAYEAQLAAQAELQAQKLLQAQAQLAAQAQSQAQALAAQAAAAQNLAAQTKGSSAMPQDELRASSVKKVMVAFEGFGKWATVTDISNAGIRVRAIAPAPPEIQSRVVELELDLHLNVRLKFHQQDGADYFFKFVRLTPTDKISLNRWLLNLAG